MFEDKHPNFKVRKDMQHSVCVYCSFYLSRTASDKLMFKNETCFGDDTYFDIWKQDNDVGTFLALDSQPGLCYIDRTILCTFSKIFSFGSASDEEKITRNIILEESTFEVN